MYRIIVNNETLGMTEAPNYVKKAGNGCFVLCAEEEAQGIVHNGTVYQLMGREFMIPWEPVAILAETDAGEEIARAANAGEIAFVAMAEAESLDDVTAMEHAELFTPWACPAQYRAGQLRRYEEDGKLYRCLQDHTSQADWTPDKTPSLWKCAADPAEEWPEWSQPIGAHDAYSAGDKVSHGGAHWVSSADGNVWAPGVYGWTKAESEGTA